MQLQYRHERLFSASEPALYIRFVLATLLCLSAPLLLVFHHWSWLGWWMLGAVAAFAVWRYRSKFGAHFLLLSGMLALIGLSEINTDISYGHMVMGTVLAISVLVIPYVVTNRVLHERIVSFPFRLGRKWRRRELAYIGLAAVVSYLVLPYYLGVTGSYLNWGAVPEASQAWRLFLGVNGLGIWDELFFVGVCLTLLRPHLPFVWANVGQAVLWTSFLYDLGFRGWGPLAVFAFALSQGYIFKRTNSLHYVVTVHLTVDFFLFLALVHLHHPDKFDFLITAPF